MTGTNWLTGGGSLPARRTKKTRNLPPGKILSFLAFLLDRPGKFCKVSDLVNRGFKNDLIDGACEILEALGIIIVKEDTRGEVYLFPAPEVLLFAEFVRQPDRLLPADMAVSQRDYDLLFHLKDQWLLGRGLYKREEVFFLDNTRSVAINRIPDLDPDTAGMLLESGFKSTVSLALSSAGELAARTGTDSQKADKLIRQARELARFPVVLHALLLVDKSLRDYQNIKTPVKKVLDRFGLRGRTKLVLLPRYDGTLQLFSPDFAYSWESVFEITVTEEEMLIFPPAIQKLTGVSTTTKLTFLFTDDGIYLKKEPVGEVQETDTGNGNQEMEAVSDAGTAEQVNRGTSTTKTPFPDLIVTIKPLWPGNNEPADSKDKTVFRVRVSKDGRITIPSGIRYLLGINWGMTVYLQEDSTTGLLCLSRKPVNGEIQYSESRVTKNGTVSIPSDLRKAFNLHPSTRCEVSLPVTSVSEHFMVSVPSVYHQIFTSLQQGKGDGKLTVHSWRDGFEGTGKPWDDWSKGEVLLSLDKPPVPCHLVTLSRDLRFNIPLPPGTQLLFGIRGERTLAVSQYSASLAAIREQNKPPKRGEITRSFDFKLPRHLHGNLYFFKSLAHPAGQQLLERLWSDDWIDRMASDENASKKAWKVIGEQQVSSSVKGTAIYFPSREKRGIAEEVGRVLRSQYHRKECFYDCLDVLQHLPSREQEEEGEQDGKDLQKKNSDQTQLEEEDKLGKEFIKQYFSGLKYDLNDLVKVIGKTMSLLHGIKIIEKLVEKEKSRIDTRNDDELKQLIDEELKRHNRGYRYALIRQTLRMIRKWSLGRGLDSWVMTYSGTVRPELENFVFHYGATEDRSIKYRCNGKKLVFDIKLPVKPVPTTKRNWQWFKNIKVDIPPRLRVIIREADKDGEGNLLPPRKPDLRWIRLKGGSSDPFLVFPWSFTGKELPEKRAGKGGKRQRVLTADLGEHNLATLVVCEAGKQVSKPLFFKLNGARRKKIERLYNHVSNIQRKLSRYPAHCSGQGRRDRERARLYYRLNNYRKELAHALANAIRDTALLFDCPVIVLEDLSSYEPPKGRKRKGLSRRLSNWLRGRVPDLLDYKCKLAGVKFESCNPWGTSSYCPRCGEKGLKIKSPAELRNVNSPDDLNHLLITTGRFFHCPHCGFTADRDYIAALNIYRVWRYCNKKTKLQAAKNVQFDRNRQQALQPLKELILFPYKGTGIPAHRPVFSRGTVTTSYHPVLAVTGG